MTNTKTTVRKSSAKKTVSAEAPVEAANSAAPVIAEAIAESEREVFKIRPVIDPHAIVTVRNGFHGKLVYKSRRTGERYEWNEFGDEQEMEVQELRNAKGSDKAFFSNNWFLFDDPEVIDYLGVNVYYRNALKYEDFDSLFELEPEEMTERIGLLSEGQKKSVAYRAVQLIEEDRIDSRHKIKALQNALGIQLVE